MLTPTPFEQMRRPAEGRRTIYLEGKAVAARLTAALRDRLPGPSWCEDRFQLGLATSHDGGGMLVLATRETLDSDQAGAVHITLTLCDPDGSRFAGARDDWWSWWSSQVDDAELVVR